MNFREGDVIGDRYRLVERLGEGSVGCVFLVWDSIRQDEIVLKILHPDIVLRNGGFHVISEHLSKLCRLHHPHIASFFDYQEIEGHVILCGEYVTGQTLESVLESGSGPDSESPAFRSGSHLWEILVTITETLNDASTTTPHLGLHPGNLRFNEQGRCILTDFGLNALNAPLAVINTARLNRREHYLAPEWFRDPKGPQDSRCDQYSFGILAAECLSKLKLQPSSEIQSILFRMTKADPESRYPDWNDIRTGFRKHLKGAGGRRKPNRAAPVSSGILFTAATAIVAVLVSFYSQWSSAQEKRNEDRFLDSLTETRYRLDSIQAQRVELLKSLVGIGEMASGLIEAVANTESQPVVEQLLHAELRGLEGETKAADALIQQASESLRLRERQLQDMAIALDSLKTIAKLDQQQAPFTHQTVQSDLSLPHNLSTSMARIQQQLVNGDFSAAAVYGAKVRDEARASQLNYIKQLLQLAHERQHTFSNLLRASKVPVIEPRDSPSDLVASAERFAAEAHYIQSADHATKAIQLYEQWIEEWNQIPDPGDLRVNSLGMRFQRIKGLWVSVWETRVYDFAVFVRESGHDPMRLWITWDPTRGITHPVRSVTRYDAKVMCQWLTERERGLGRLSENEAYRLPTDLEWSAFAGLPPESGNTPEERGWLDIEHYPWEGQAPRQAHHGNYLTWDSATEENNYGGFMDPWMETSPVGRFPANSFGLYDLGGNVAEWVLDDFRDPNQKGRTTRGGSFLTFSLKNMRTNSRRSKPSGGEDVGFRVVIARTTHE